MISRHRRVKFALISALALSALIVACTKEEKPAPESKPAPPAVRPIGAVIEIKAPLGLPPIPVPADNPPTVETIALGRRLYYDPQISVDGSISCASCHHPDKGFADDKPFSEGVRKQLGGRN